MSDLDEVLVPGYYTGGHRARGRSRDVTAERRKYAIVSVDDHVCEPPDTYQRRLPQRYVDRAPRIERTEGLDYWVFENERIAISSPDGMVSWEPDEWDTTPVTFDEFRPGVFDVRDRIADMDLCGIFASVNFPSIVVGFAGQRFMKFKDQELGLAAMRAYNDWMIEDWTGSYPDRLIPSQVTWLPDPEIAALEIRKNAERGFKGVSFSENPEKLGLSSIHTGYWDPIFRACEDTDTVVHLHTGSSSTTLVPSTDSSLQAIHLLLSVNAMSACVDWLHSPVPLDFPELKIVLTEGGIGWLPMLLDRMKYQERQYLPQGLGRHNRMDGISQRELLHRNFWFTAFYDPLSFAFRHEIGIDRILLEVDYPHGDSTWPHAQKVVDEQIGSYSKTDIEQLTFANACKLYRHQTPPASFLVDESADAYPQSPEKAEREETR